MRLALLVVLGLGLYTCAMPKRVQGMSQRKEYERLAAEAERKRTTNSSSATAMGIGWGWRGAAAIARCVN